MRSSCILSFLQTRISIAIRIEKSSSTMEIESSIIDFSIWHSDPHPWRTASWTTSIDRDRQLSQNSRTCQAPHPRLASDDNYGMKIHSCYRQWTPGLRRRICDQHGELMWLPTLFCFRGIGRRHLTEYLTKNAGSSPHRAACTPEEWYDILILLPKLLVGLDCLKMPKRSNKDRSLYAWGIRADKITPWVFLMAWDPVNISHDVE